VISPRFFAEEGEGGETPFLLLPIESGLPATRSSASASSSPGGSLPTAAPLGVPSAARNTKWGTPRTPYSATSGAQRALSALRRTKLREEGEEEEGVEVEVQEVEASFPLPLALAPLYLFATAAESGASALQTSQ